MRSLGKPHLYPREMALRDRLPLPRKSTADSKLTEVILGLRYPITRISRMHLIHLSSMTYTGLPAPKDASPST